MINTTNTTPSMYDEIREKAEKKVQAKQAFYICSIVFAFTTVILLMLSFYLPSVGFWLVLPIPAFIMVLSIIYVAAFGLPTKGAFSTDWRDEEVEKEMVTLYRERKALLPPLEELSEEEKLELQALERLEKAWTPKEHLV